MASVTDWPNRIRHYVTSIDVEMPQRVILCAFGFLAVVNMYLMRYAIDVACHRQILNVPAKETTKETPTDSTKPYPKRANKPQTKKPSTKKTKTPPSKKVNVGGNGAATAKPNPKKVERKVEQSATALALTPVEVHSLPLIPLMAFYLGYALMHVPGAMLAERYGGKRVLVVAVTLTAVFTVLTPIALSNAGPYTVIVIRLMIGLCEGPTFPALCALLSHWVPRKERGTLGAVALSGGQLAVFLMSILAHLADFEDDCNWIFYAIGVCSLMWVVCFCVLCSSEPSTNPFIKEDEKKYLQMEIDVKCPAESSTTPNPPWLDILTNLPIWAVISAAAQYDWTEVQQFSELTNVIQGIGDANKEGSLNLPDSFPFLLKWLVSLLAGVLSDLLVNWEILSTTTTRRLMTTIVGLGTIVSSTYFEHLYCSMGAMGAYYASIILTPLDMSPNYAGTIMAMVNGVGSMSGTLALYLQSINAEGAFTKFNEVRAAVWFVCTVLISGDIQAFNEVEEESEHTPRDNTVS